MPFEDKYHFKNYLRKIAEKNFAIEKSFFDQQWQATLLSIYDFEHANPTFFRNLNVRICEKIGFDFAKITAPDRHYAIHLLSDDYPRLNKELTALTKHINEFGDAENKDGLYGLQLSNYSILFRLVTEVNKNLNFQKREREISDAMSDFITSNENSLAFIFYTIQIEIYFISVRVFL